jgi:putative redox protein
MSALDLRQLYEQQTRVLTRHPSLGKSSVQASVKLVADAPCEARRAHRVIRVDLPLDDGGTDSAPTPGDLMRASIGACMAMSYRSWAARLGVDLRSVEVDVTCEFDARGQLGIADDVAIGWERLILEVRIVSAAAPAEVRRVVETADRLSPMLANLSPDIARAHALTISKPE